MRAELALFLGAALLIALLGFLTAPPVTVTIDPFGAEPVLVGSPVDYNGTGTGVAYSILEELGYRVTFNPEDSYDGVVILSYTGCSEETNNYLLGLAGGGGKKYLVVARDLDGCMRSLATTVLGTPPPGKPIEGVNLVLAEDESIWYTIDGLVAGRPTGEPLASTYPRIGFIAERAEYNDVTVVLYYDTDAFIDPSITTGASAGLDPAGMLAFLIHAAGGTTGDTILVPLDVFRKEWPWRVKPITFSIDRAGIASAIIRGLLEIEEEIWSSIDEWLLPLLALVAVPIAMAATAAGTRALGGRVEHDSPVTGHVFIPVHGLSREYYEAVTIARKGRIDKAGAKRLIRGLYVITSEAIQARYGVGLEEALGDERVLEDIARRSGMRREEVARLLSRLHVVYTRKVEGNKLLPLVRIRREALALYRGLLPVLRGLGLSVERAGGGSVGREG